MIRTKVKLVLIAFLIAILTFTTVAFATEATDNPEVTPTDIQAEGGDTTEETAEDQINSSDKYFAGDNIVIDELIDGNAVAIGKEVTLTGQIGGDLIVIADKLTIDGGTTGGFVYGNVLAMASEVVITTGQIYDAYIVCDKLTVDFDVIIRRDLKAMGTEVSIDGLIVRNAFIEADKLTVKGNCEIRGDLNYIAQQEAEYLEKTEEDDESIDAGIKGNTEYKIRDKKLYSKNNAIKSKVDSILKSNKIDNNTSEEALQSIVLANIMNMVGIDTNSSITSNAKGVSKTIQVPVAAFYIEIVVIILLVASLVAIVVMKDKILNKSTEKSDK